VPFSWVTWYCKGVNLFFNSAFAFWSFSLSDIFLKQKEAYLARKNLSFTTNSQTRLFALYGMGQISPPPTPHNSFQNKFRSTATPVRINTVQICEQWQQLLSTLQVSPTPIFTHVMQHSQPFHSIQPLSVLSHSILEPNCTRWSVPNTHTAQTQGSQIRGSNFHHRAICQKLLGLTSENWRHCDPYL